MILNVIGEKSGKISKLIMILKNIVLTLLLQKISIRKLKIIVGGNIIFK